MATSGAFIFFLFSPVSNQRWMARFYPWRFRYILTKITQKANTIHIFHLELQKKTPKEVTHAENYEMIVILNLTLNFKWPCGLKKSVFTLKFWKVEKKLWINFAWTLHLTEFNLTLIFSKGQQQLMTSYFWKRVFK